MRGLFVYASTIMAAVAVASTFAETEFAMCIEDKYYGYNGTLIEEREDSSMDECCTLCWKEEDCLGFSVSGQGDGTDTCKLYSEIIGRIDYNGVFGIIVTSGLPGMTTEGMSEYLWKSFGVCETDYNFAYDGKLIEEHEGANIDVCNHLCWNEETCVGFTVVDHTIDAPTCQLFSKITDRSDVWDAPSISGLTRITLNELKELLHSEEKEVSSGSSSKEE